MVDKTNLYRKNYNSEAVNIKTKRCETNETTFWISQKAADIFIGDNDIVSMISKPSLTYWTYAWN